MERGALTKNFSRVNTSPGGATPADAAAAVPGTAFEVDIRGTRTPARVVSMPFYKRKAKA